jgi:hypothetical protein
MQESVRVLRATATQAEQEAQYLQDNPEAAAQALKEDAERDAAAARDRTAASSSGNGDAPETNGTVASEEQQEQEEEEEEKHAQDDEQEEEQEEDFDGAPDVDGPSSEAEGQQFEDSDSSVGVYEETTDDENEDLESVEGLHNSIQRQRSRLQTLMKRVESLQHLAANLEAQEVRVTAIWTRFSTAIWMLSHVISVAQCCANLHCELEQCCSSQALPCIMLTRTQVESGAVHRLQCHLQSTYSLSVWITCL